MSPSKVKNQDDSGTLVVPETSNRSSMFRKRLARDGYTRWEIYTAESIKIATRGIAQREGQSPGMMAEALLALGIDAYRTTFNLNNSLHSAGQHDLQNVSQSSSEGQWTGPLNPRCKLSLPDCSSDHQSSGSQVTPTTSDKTQPQMDLTSMTLTSEHNSEQKSREPFGKICDEISRYSEHRRMDREKHKIRPVSDPIEPGGKNHSKFLEFKGQTGFFYVATLSFRGKNIEAIFFCPKGGGQQTLITDLSSEKELLMGLNKLLEPPESIEVLEMRSKDLEFLLENRKGIDFLIDPGEVSGQR